jgi:hypothetical protein
MGVAELGAHLPGATFLRSRPIRERAPCLRDDDPPQRLQTSRVRGIGTKGRWRRVRPDVFYRVPEDPTGAKALMAGQEAWFKRLMESGPTEIQPKWIAAASRCSTSWTRYMTPTISAVRPCESVALEPTAITSGRDLRISASAARGSRSTRTAGPAR